MCSFTNCIITLEVDDTGWLTLGLPVKASIRFDMLLNQCTVYQCNPYCYNRGDSQCLSSFIILLLSSYLILLSPFMFFILCGLIFLPATSFPPGFPHIPSSIPSRGKDFFKTSF